MARTRKLAAPALAALILGLLAPAAQATLEYRGGVTVEGWVVGNTTQHEVLIDPPNGGLRTDATQVHAGRELFLSGTGLFDAQIVAQAAASADSSGAGLRAVAWSSQQVLSPFQGGYSNGRAEVGLQLSVLVQGAPGSSGTVRLLTQAGAAAVPAPAGGTARPSSANVSATASLLTGDCRTPPGSPCFAQQSFGLGLRDGSTFLGPVDLPWELQITAEAGDTLNIFLSATAQADNGYGVGAWLGLPWAGIAPFGAAGVDPQDAAAGALGSLWLSPGLSLAPTAGLVLRPDGSYGFTAPVPEPSTWLLMAGGLLGLLRTSRRAA